MRQSGSLLGCGLFHETTPVLGMRRRAREDESSSDRRQQVVNQHVHPPSEAPEANHHNAAVSDAVKVLRGGFRKNLTKQIGAFSKTETAGDEPAVAQFALTHAAIRSAVGEQSRMGRQLLKRTTSLSPIAARYDTHRRSLPFDRVLEKPLLWIMEDRRIQRRKLGVDV
jgi:hypothetical protein